MTLDRKTQLLLLSDFIKINGIRFVTPYFQTLAGQTQSDDVIVKSIGIKEFNNAVKNQNPKQLRKQFLNTKKNTEAILVGRDADGSHRGSLNLSKDNKIEIYYNNKSKQEKVINKNTKKKMVCSKKLLCSVASTQE